MASCKRLELEDGQDVLRGDPRLDQPLPGPRRDLAVPRRAEPEPRQVVDGPPLELGQPADDVPSGLLGRRVGLHAVEPAPDLHPGRDGIEPGHRDVPTVEAAVRAVAVAARLAEPSPRRTRMPLSPSRRPRIISPVRCRMSQVRILRPTSTRFQ